MFFERQLLGKSLSPRAILLCYMKLEAQQLRTFSLTSLVSCDQLKQLKLFESLSL